MNTTASSAVLDELLDPISRCLTPEVAQRIAGLRASPQFQQKMDTFAERSAEGTLTAAERAEYETCVRAMTFVGVLQAKARAVIATESLS